MVYCLDMINLDRWVDLRDRVLVMGILNITPDSFFDGGCWLAPEDALRRAEQMMTEGADILDIGGESTRPGATPVGPEEELRRVMPVLERLRNKLTCPISIDTRHARVAREALAVGTVIINDISALRADPDMMETCAAGDAFVVLMHMQGMPQTMQASPKYDDVVRDVHAFLSSRCRAAVSAGIPERRLIVDPGIGFGKTIEHNVDLIKRLHEFRDLNVPILVGTSRKSFLGTILDEPVEGRLEGTIAANAAAIIRGADIIRVHDVKEGRRTADVAGWFR